VPIDFQKISMEFAGFSEDAVAYRNVVHFRRGKVKQFVAHGLRDCTVDSVAADPLYRSPMAQMKTRVTCALNTPPTQREPFTIGWTLRY
jgi:hypothetical protein